MIDADLEAPRRGPYRPLFHENSLLFVVEFVKAENSSAPFGESNREFRRSSSSSMYLVNTIFVRLKTSSRQASQNAREITHRVLLGVLGLRWEQIFEGFPALLPPRRGGLVLGKLHHKAEVQVPRPSLSEGHAAALRCSQAGERDSRRCTAAARAKRASNIRPSAAL